MTGSQEPSPGTLYLVGTPIGNLSDCSPRARKVLEAVDRIACEDTRRTGLLLHSLGIRSHLISFHQHNQTARIPQLLAALAAGEAVAVVSDAGLPGISDPGEELVAAARRQALPVICVPGPSAVTTALVSSGLPTGRFCFEGFLPPAKAPAGNGWRPCGPKNAPSCCSKRPIACSPCWRICWRWWGIAPCGWPGSSPSGTKSRWGPR